MLSLLLIVLHIQFMAISLETQPFVMYHVKFTTTYRFYTNIISYTHADNLTLIYASQTSNSQFMLSPLLFKILEFCTISCMTFFIKSYTSGVESTTFL